MSNIKLAIIYNYNRTGRLKKDGTASVQIKAYLNGKNRYFNTGIYIEPCQWDKSNNATWVINHPRELYHNSQLRKTLDKMESYIHKVANQNEVMTLERLGDYDNELVHSSFTDFYEQELENAVLRKGSFTDQRQTLNKLKQFRKDIYFSDLTHRFVSAFNSYLSNQLHLSINTVAKHHKNLKAYVRKAINFGYIDNNKDPYKKFKVRREPTERLYLTEQELIEFERLAFTEEKENLERIKDFFLFSCYTGLRFSDSSKLTVKNILNDDDGLTIYFKAIKTRKTIRLSLKKLFNGKPERLLKKYLDKYSDFYYDDPDKPMPIFHGMTNQYINRELKKIVRHLNIRHALKIGISSHIGRHTFGTIMAGKVPIPILQKLMQHSKIKETMVYVHLNQEMVNDALDKVQW